jgi:hypothetical protein
MAQQLQTLRRAALDQAAFQDFPEEAHQDRHAQRDEFVGHGKGNLENRSRVTDSGRPAYPQKLWKSL